MSLLVNKPGILTTVQDLGRTGYRALGINPAGVMDRYAARLINILLGNQETESVLELHFPAGEFEFHVTCSFALGGADFGANLNGNAIRNWSITNAGDGDVLKFSERRNGNRAYLAVAGGFDIDPWLESRSTNLAAGAGGYSGRRLAPNDKIHFVSPRVVDLRALGPTLIPRYSRFPTVRIIPGGEFDQLTASSEQAFLNDPFTLSMNSNRMGYRLTGPPLHIAEAKELVSAGVTFGTIQLLPDGQLVVLMADHQTSGGYPRIGNVIEADLPLLAQLGPGDGISFHSVTVEEAEQAVLSFERELRFLKTGVAFAA